MSSPIIIVKRIRENPEAWRVWIYNPAYPQVRSAPFYCESEEIARAHADQLKEELHYTIEFQGA